MDVVMVTSEAVPFAKTGGLADVCGSLPAKLTSHGHRCSVFLPAYQKVFHAGVAIESTDVGFVLPLAGRSISCRVMRVSQPLHGVDFYFIDQPHFFDRSGLYGDHHGDYRDNCERFCFFNRAVAMAIELLRIKVDILHCHDWQAGLLPAYVKLKPEPLTWYDRAATVMTIHNLAYQGRFWQHDMPLTGLDWHHFNMQELEFYGDICLLKAGIVFADHVTTVSPTYAKEIQTQAFGCGMESILQSRAERLTGIVNGVDYHVWNPMTDTHLPQCYDASTWEAGKETVRKALSQELGLPEDPSVPLIGIVGRLADQKGWDLIIPILREWLPQHPAQWVILGSGDPHYQQALAELAHQYPQKLAVRLEFSESLSHRIEAASSLFLMPSRYEPCGLNQLYSLKYGAVPIVHATGGLVDTVVDHHSASATDGSATGFCFHQYSVASAMECLHRACDLWYRDREAWRKIVMTGMQQDWSWNQSALRYEEIYRSILKR